MNATATLIEKGEFTEDLQITWQIEPHTVETPYERWRVEWTLEPKDKLSDIIDALTDTAYSADECDQCIGSYVTHYRSGGSANFAYGDSVRTAGAIETEITFIADYSSEPEDRNDDQ